MMWEWIVSRRFHRSKIKSANFLGVVSMLGMGIGCFAIIISVSVMNGFEAHVHNRLRGFDGDIRIYDADIFDILQKTGLFLISCHLWRGRLYLKVVKPKR